MCLEAQVKDVEYEKQFRSESRKPEQSKVPDSLDNARFSTSRNTSFNSVFALKTSSLITQKYRLEMSPGYLDRLKDLTSKKLSFLTRDPSEEPSMLLSSGELKYLENRLTFGMSSAYNSEKSWTAHLQKADFEMIANQLSLNDINRYTFRKNRQSGNTVPVQTVVSEEVGESSR
jgi:hypothetical protein